MEKGESATEEEIQRYMERKKRTKSMRERERERLSSTKHEECK